MITNAQLEIIALYEENRVVKEMAEELLTWRGVKINKDSSGLDSPCDNCDISERPSCSKCIGC